MSHVRGVWSLLAAAPLVGTGCDGGARNEEAHAMGDARGRWEARGGALVLSGLRGNDTTTVELAPDFDGLLATGPVMSSDGSPTQRWPRGGVCPVCKNPDGGPVMGPIEVRACDNPSLP